MAIPAWLDDIDYDGTIAHDITIDGLELAEGHRVEGWEIVCDFVFDCTQWEVETACIETFIRTPDGDGYVFHENRFPIHDKPEWRGLVDACARWADKNLDPKDYA